MSHGRSKMPFHLKKAYNDLQSHSSNFSSFPLSWPDLHSHFTKIQTTLSQRLLHLQSLESQFQQNQNDPLNSPSKLPDPKPKKSNFSSIPNDPSSSSIPKSSISHLEALISFCKNNDGKWLRDFIKALFGLMEYNGISFRSASFHCIPSIQTESKENFNDMVVIKYELQVEFKSASNPANMVLDAIDGLLGSNVMVDLKDSRLIKRSCNFLFQQLRVFSPYVSHEPSWNMAFLQFATVYGFLVDLNVGELAAHCAIVAACDEIPELYQVIALSDKVEGSK